MSTLLLRDESLFSGRYRLLRCIAQGGMGAVYEALHVGTERRCALKVMLPHVVKSESARRRFRQEARVAAQVKSEFIVDVLDAGIDDATGMPFIVMEMLEGEELGQRLASAGRLAPDEVVTHLQQVALALDRTHRAGIVHRDLKPANLFLARREDGPPRIKVLDFGIAKMLLESSGAAPGTQCVGTPLYMAPEQLHAGVPISTAADVYALGMLAFTLLVGSPYWQEESDHSSNVYALMMITARGPVEGACARAARQGVGLPEAFDAWFHRATHGDPLLRFPGAVEAVAELCAVLGAGVSDEGAGASSPPIWAPAVMSSAETDATASVTGAAPRASTLPRLAGVTGAALLFAAVVAGLVRGCHDPASAPVQASAMTVSAVLSASATTTAPLDSGSAAPPVPPVESAHRPDAGSVASALSGPTPAPHRPSRTPPMPSASLYSRD